jgi:hypothetical protein
MNAKIFGFATLLFAIASSALAAPIFTAVPAGIQAGSWVWNIDITPDLTLIPDNSGTPVALEFGFRLSGGQLLSATIADPVQFDTPNPGPKVFGWETPDPLFPNPAYGYGLQSNLVTNEVFASYGSINFTTPGPKHFLTIRTSGPPLSPSSTIQWLGAYSGTGKITQVTGQLGTTYTTGDFFFAGTATQAIPEPASAAMIAIGLAVGSFSVRRRRSIRGSRS